MLEFSYNELARLNQIMSVALLSGKITLDDTTKSVYAKITEQISNMVSDQLRSYQILSDNQDCRKGGAT